MYTECQDTFKLKHHVKVHFKGYKKFSYTVLLLVGACKRLEKAYSLPLAIGTWSQNATKLDKNAPTQIN